MKATCFSIVLFIIATFGCFAQPSKENEALLKGEWEGAGITKSLILYGKETLSNSRLLIDSLGRDYITGIMAQVVQENDYSSCTYRFKARKTGDHYTASSLDFKEVINPRTGQPYYNCYRKNDPEGMTMNISLIGGGLLITFTGKYANSKTYFFKSKPGTIAIEQNKRINEQYESWKSLKPGEKEKQQTERISKWYNQRELYSLTSRTKDLDKTGFSYRYFPGDSLLVVKIDNVVPVPFKMMPEDYKDLDLSYIDKLNVSNAFFQTLDIDSDYGLNGIWLITASLENLVPKKKIYYPSKETYDRLMNITQTKFSEKIGSTLITLPKVEDEKIFGNIAWKAETNPQGNAAARTAVPDKTVQLDLAALADCRKLVQTGKSPEEKEELQKNYQALLGVVQQLGQYRADYLEAGKLINLFPTAYYHTTVSEMKRIIATREFKYPIEKMKQMLAFYDAYRFNRENWDNGNTNVVEKHWLEQFKYSTGATNGFYSGFVLSLGITAHVEFDLLRALEYAYQNRYNKALGRNDPDLLADFLKTNSIFKETRAKTITDIIQAMGIPVKADWFSDKIDKILAWKEGLGIDIYNEAYNKYNSFFSFFSAKEVFTDNDVINSRQNAWMKFQQNLPLGTFNGYKLLGQPLTRHEMLIEIGNKICPSETQPGKKTFVINPKDVTLPTDKKFKWYEWDKAPEDLRIAAEYVHVFKNHATNKDETLNAFVEEDQKNKCTVKIAAIDLNNDGICGLAIFAEGENCCGRLGCSYGFYDNGGLLSTGKSVDDEMVPAKNGVKGANNSFVFELTVKTDLAVDKNEIAKLFTYDKSKSEQVVKPVIPSNLTGGANPEELGKVMLKALQTNNKNLWASCIHPTYESTDPKHRQKTIDEFDQIKEEFEAQGISDWTKTTFSRVTFERCDQCAPPGEKWVRHLIVEFWYKGKEFICAVAFTPVITYKGKYFVGSNYFHDVKRNINK